MDSQYRNTKQAYVILKGGVVDGHIFENLSEGSVNYVTTKCTRKETYRDFMEIVNGIDFNMPSLAVYESANFFPAAFMFVDTSKHIINFVYELTIATKERSIVLLYKNAAAEQDKIVIKLPQLAHSKWLDSDIETTNQLLKFDVADNCFMLKCRSFKYLSKMNPSIPQTAIMMEQMDGDLRTLGAKLRHVNIFVRLLVTLVVCYNLIYIQTCLFKMKKIYRDAKCENIFYKCVNGTYQIKYGDIGSLVELGDVGTSTYVHPYSGKIPVTINDSIFGIFIIFVELLGYSPKQLAHTFAVEKRIAALRSLHVALVKAISIEEFQKLYTTSHPAIQEIDEKITDLLFALNPLPLLELIKKQPNDSFVGFNIYVPIFDLLENCFFSTILLLHELLRPVVSESEKLLLDNLKLPKKTPIDVIELETTIRAIKQQILGETFLQSDKLTPVYSIDHPFVPVKTTVHARKLARLADTTPVEDKKDT